MAYAQASNPINPSAGANATESNVSLAEAGRIGIGETQKNLNAWIVSTSWGTNEH